MRLRHGGFTPVLDGRPTGRVDDLPLPHSLIIELHQQVPFTPVVIDGQQVSYGQQLAVSEDHPGGLEIPSPVSGRVRITDGEPVRAVFIEDATEEPEAPAFTPVSPERASRTQIRETLAKAGLWQAFWSSEHRGIPPNTDGEGPARIVVNCIFTEPFRARGNVVIARSWDTIIQGIRYLQRIVADYGRIEIVLTAPNNPLAKRMYADLAGFAWVHFHPASLKYPIEHPAILSDLVRRSARKPGDRPDNWVVGIQDVESMGAVLADGRPPVRRIVAVGGPGAENPRHVSVVIGTKLAEIAAGDHIAVLRGGIMNGEAVDPESSGIRPDDDSVFLLPEATSREMFGFMRPGFTRTSHSRAFVSRLTRARDRHITASTRGELRPCIACGACEDVCPVGLLPQVLHRYLYGNRIDDAERVGLMHCIDCRLCTYVCPSKIELQAEFADARAQLQREHAEVDEANRQAPQSSEPREDWHEAPKTTS